MANNEQLKTLKQGVEVWNQWRKEHADIELDLSEADLYGANLSEADLTGADLTGADLIGADLTRADLTRATLTRADLSEANLYGADLSQADLSEANLIGANLTTAILSEADLSQADLSRASLTTASLNGTDLTRADLTRADLSETNLNGADLSETNLNGADLTRADLSETICWDTIFADIDLQTIKGLESVNHDGPSSIDIRTLYRSQGNIPEVFLKGAGVDDAFITYIRSLVGKPIEYYSCFISYSSKDEALARRLYADLQSKNVRCWFAPEDLKWGERIRTGIDEAIRLHDKLLLILSKSSVASGWVEREVQTALARERKEKRVVLFPVRIDGAIFESPFAWATEIRHERNIGDFTRWKNHDAYEQAFARLLRDLKAEA